MLFRSTGDGVQIDIRVKPNSKEFGVHLESGEMIVFCKAAPENGKANRELIKELSKLFRCEVRIVSGLTSRHKTIQLSAVDVEKLRKVLSERL